MKNKSLSQSFFLIITILVISIYLSLKTDDFLTIGNFYDLINSYAMLAILACGLFIVLISGGIDISFPAITIISQYIMVSFIMKHDGNYFIVFLISTLSGIILGLINAFIINKLRVPSIIITISTLNIFYGLLLYITKGIWLYDYPSWFQEEIILFKSTTVSGVEYGLSFQFILLIAVIFLTGFIMNKTSIGRKIYALGGNAEAASRIGFSLLKLHLFVYGYMGFVSGIAGIVQSYTVQTVAPDSLLGYELTVLAAVVLGGTSLIGGKGTLAGTMMGVILLAIIQNGLNLLGISSYWQTVVTGLIIVLSVSMTAWSQRNKIGV